MKEEQDSNSTEKSLLRKYWWVWVLISVFILGIILIVVVLGLYFFLNFSSESSNGNYESLDYDIKEMRSNFEDKIIDIHQEIVNAGKERREIDQDYVEWIYNYELAMENNPDAFTYREEQIISGLGSMMVEVTIINSLKDEGKQPSIKSFNELSVSVWNMISAR